MDDLRAALLEAPAAHVTATPTAGVVRAFVIVQRVYRAAHAAGGLFRIFHGLVTP
jgi:hypothetical protein